MVLIIMNLRRTTIHPTHMTKMITAINVVDVALVINVEADTHLRVKRTKADTVNMTGT